MNPTQPLWAAAVPSKQDGASGAGPSPALSLDKQWLNAGAQRHLSKRRLHALVESTQLDVPRMAPIDVVRTLDAIARSPWSPPVRALQVVVRRLAADDAAAVRGLDPLVAAHVLASLGIAGVNFESSGSPARRVIIAALGRTKALMAETAAEITATGRAPASVLGPTAVKAILRLVATTRLELSVIDADMPEAFGMLVASAAADADTHELRDLLSAARLWPDAPDTVWDAAAVHAEQLAVRAAEGGDQMELARAAALLCDLANPGPAQSMVSDSVLTAEKALRRCDHLLAAAIPIFGLHDALPLARSLVAGVSASGGVTRALTVAERRGLKRRARLLPRSATVLADRLLRGVHSQRHGAEAVRLAFSLAAVVDDLLRLHPSVDDRATMPAPLLALPGAASSAAPATTEAVCTGADAPSKTHEAVVLAEGERAASHRDVVGRVLAMLQERHADLPADTVADGIGMLDPAWTREHLDASQATRLIMTAARVATAVQPAQLAKITGRLAECLRKRVDESTAVHLAELFQQRKWFAPLTPLDASVALRGIAKLPNPDPIASRALARHIADVAPQCPLAHVPAVAAALCGAQQMAPKCFAALSAAVLRQATVPDGAPPGGHLELLEAFGSLSAAFATRRLHGSAFDSLRPVVRALAVERAHVFTVAELLTALESFAVLDVADVALSSALSQRLIDLHLQAGDGPAAPALRALVGSGRLSASAAAMLLGSLARSALDGSEENRWHATALLPPAIFACCSQSPELHPADSVTAIVALAELNSPSAMQRSPALRDHSELFANGYSTVRSAFLVAFRDLSVQDVASKQGAVDHAIAALSAVPPDAYVALTSTYAAHGLLDREVVATVCSFVNRFGIALRMEPLPLAQYIVSITQLLAAPAASATAGGRRHAAATTASPPCADAVAKRDESSAGPELILPPLHAFIASARRLPDDYIAAVINAIGEADGAPAHQAQRRTPLDSQRLLGSVAKVLVSRHGPTYRWASSAAVTEQHAAAPDGSAAAVGAVGHPAECDTRGADALFDDLGE